MRAHPQDPGPLVEQLATLLDKLQDVNDSTMSSGQPTNAMCVQRWIDECRMLLQRSLVTRMRDAAATLDEVMSAAGPWGQMPEPDRWTADELRQHADSLEQLLHKVLASTDD